MKFIDLPWNSIYNDLMNGMPKKYVCEKYGISYHRLTRLRQMVNEQNIENAKVYFGD